MLNIQSRSLNPVNILKGEAEEEKAETARLSSFIGAIAIGELVKSTLGPKGMDKILLCEGRNEGRVEVTNDGATILRSVGVDNPAAKVLIDISKVSPKLILFYFYLFLNISLIFELLLFKTRHKTTKWATELLL
jgi:hypothetical protein